MLTDYPIEITDPDGSVRIAGLADFTDPDNQPQPGDATPGAPYKPADNASDVTVAEDFEGNLVVAGGDATNGGYLQSSDTDAFVVASNLGVHIADNSGFEIVNGEVNAVSLGPLPAYVTDAAAPPTVYVTPLVWDHTAVTGGLYAWTGSAYLQVGGPLA